MPRVLRLAAAPLVRGLTYRRYVHLLLGAVLALPCVALGWLFGQAAAVGGMDPVAFGLLVAVAVAAVVAAALLPGVRVLEIAAARALLGIELPEPATAAWQARLRAAGWLLVNMVTGGATALLTLIVVPGTVGFLIAPARVFPPLPTGAAAAWTPFVGLLFPVVSLYLVAAAGAGLARLAPRMLGPTPAERLATELAAARQTAEALAERNRLARELHDSVGHALTITTLQAEAASHRLEADPAAARRALETIAEVGRSAMEDLDHVLGLLREDASAEGGQAPQPDLGDLDALLASARSAGVRVDAELVGETAWLPATVSREAYRIMQEGLTNALRHAGAVPVSLRIVVRGDELELQVTNPLGSGRRRGGGGRGLAGMRERVGVLHGELEAGPHADDWRLAVRLPW